MIRLTQKRTGHNGTCFPTALASILETTVPDFGPTGETDEQVYWSRVDAWLARHGLRYIQVPIGAVRPVGYSTIEGISPRGGMHACVAYDGRLVWDPHPADGTPHGLAKPMTYGLLLPLNGNVQTKTTNVNSRAYDALRGSELLSAVEPVYERHDDVKYDSRRAERDRAETAYRAAERDVASLVKDVESLLSQSRMPDKAVWKERLGRAKVALEYARRSASAREWPRALGQQEYALTVAHHVLDALRGLARRTGAKDALGVNRDYKTAERRAKTNLARHAELMKKYMEQGLSREEASRKALEEMERGKKAKDASPNYVESLWNNHGAHYQKFRSFVEGQARLLGAGAVKQITDRTFDVLRGLDARYDDVKAAVVDVLNSQSTNDALTPVPPYKPGDVITLHNHRKTTVTKVLPARNLLGEKEWHVSTASGDVVILKRSAAARDSRGAKGSTGRRLGPTSSSTKAKTAKVDVDGRQVSVIQRSYGWETMFRQPSGDYVSARTLKELQEKLKA